MNQKRILLIVGGGIAAYKAYKCELVRTIRKAGHAGALCADQGRARNSLHR
jgi:phosphopantothenoylcysteine synthetase/decarboxylase